MRASPRQLAVSSILHRKTKINPKPQYQRRAVWSLDDKQLLMDTILRRYDIPKFYFRVTNGKYEYEVVDGQQRLRAIWDYCDGVYPLGNVSNDIPDLPELEGRHFEDLDSDCKDLIHSFELSITEIWDETETEIRDLFLRLQGGKALNPAEKRNAMEGNMRDFISDTLAKHNVFANVKIKSDRFEYDDWAAHVSLLELSGVSADVKAINLKKMYEREENFDQNGSKARKIVRVLNYLKKVIDDKPPEMNIKWGFVDMYLLISDLIEEYDIKNRHRDFSDFYKKFEVERRSVDDATDLLKGSHQERDLHTYMEAFNREGARKDNIEKRRKVYRRRFQESYQDLVPKDSQRSYTEDDRIVLWRKAGMKCEEPSCGKTLELHEMHADHIIPHSSGGKTTIENGQCLCVQCNIAKSDS